MLRSVGAETESRRVFVFLESCFQLRPTCPVSPGACRSAAASPSPTVRKPTRFSGRKLSAHFPVRSSASRSGHAAVLHRRQEGTLGTLRLRFFRLISRSSWVILSPPRPPRGGGGQRGEVRASCRRTVSTRRRAGAR